MTKSSDSGIASSLMVMMVTLLPDEYVIKTVEDAIKDFKDDPTDKQKVAMLGSTCMMLATKMRSKLGDEGRNEIEESFEVAKSLQQREDWQKLNPNLHKQ